jgi:hypothetical protein
MDLISKYHKDHQQMLQARLAALSGHHGTITARPALT